MFELSVSTTFEKQKYIQELYTKLADEIKADKGVVVKQNYLGRSHFAFAVPDFKKEYYKAKILDYIVFMIIDDYKFSFFRENLILGSKSVISQSFLKAISIFDSEMDSKYIRRKIVFSGEIHVDSYYYFKMTDLQSRWQRTVDIINQNNILSNSESMIEVLKYLTISSENFLVSADVTVSKKQIKVKKPHATLCFSRDFNGCSDFLTELVSMNPMKINIKSDGKKYHENEKIVELLSRIFSDKIYIVN